MDISITCDSAADLNAEIIKNFDIKVIPYTIIMDNVDYKDGVDLTPEMIIEYTKNNKELPKTAALNEYDFEVFFKNNLKKDGLIHFCLSSKISGTYEFAKKAAEKFENVVVIDTLSLSSGISVQIMYALELLNKGLGLNEIAEKVNSRRSAVQISFATYKLDNLHKGGRCTSLQLLGANLLKIRPSIALINGKMEMHKKYMGKMDKVVEKYMLDTFEEFSTPDTNLAFITYSSATPEMLDVAKSVVKEKFKFNKVIYNRASATITTHCGENTIGIIYYNDGKQPKYSIEI